MTWHVQFRAGGPDQITRHPTPEAAIEAACLMIDGGVEVFGIGTGPLTDSIDKTEIAKIYALWARVAPRPAGLGQGRRACPPVPLGAVDSRDSR